MREPIEVNYEPDGSDWQVTVTGRGQQQRGTATGLIAARDRADQLVEEVAPEEERRTVVHLLNGDALAFTSAYLSARLARPTEMPTGMPGTPAAEEHDEEATEPGGRAEEPDDESEVSDEVPTVPSPTPSADQPQKASTS